MKITNLLLAAVLLSITSVTHAQGSTAPTPLLTQPADTHIATLKANSSRKEKADACRELAVIGTSKAVPTLVPLLADDELNHIARYALERIPGSSVDEALRDELPKLKGRPLVGVIGSLGVRKDTKAVKPLSALLANSDAQVAQAAARALGSIGTTDAAKAIKNALPKTPAENRLAFHEGLFRCAEAQAASGKMKDAIALYDDLRKATDPAHQVRAGALRGAIITRSGKEALALLKESLGSSDRVLFNAAVGAGLEMKGPEVTRVLAASLPQLTPDNQLVVIQALGNRRDNAAVPALAAQAKSGPTPTRVAALRAAAAIGSSSAAAVIVQRIDDSDPAISQAAASALAGMPGRETDQAVLDLLKSPKAGTRVVGIDLAGRREIASAVPALVAAASDQDSKVRSSALQGLGKVGSPSEVPGLLKLLLGSTDEAYLDDVGMALSSICVRAGSGASTDQVVNGMSGASPKQKAALLRVLSAVGGEKSLAAVRTSLADSDASVKESAVSALAEWRDASATQDLLQVARTDTNNRQRVLALRGYVRLVRESGASDADKLKMLSDAATVATTPQDKTLVLGGLGDIRSVDSLRMVIPYLSDPAVADQAAGAAVKIADKLDAKHSADIGSALNQVLKTAKAPQVLDKARARLNQLKIPVQ